MHRLLLVGLNHTTAPLAVRERLAFSSDQRRQALLAFKERFPEAEAALLCTCNRVEFYAARTTHDHPRFEEMVEFLSQQRGIGAAELSPHLYRKHDRDTVSHLFTVASSLDSMVLGETQILGQVRQAYDIARDLGSARGQLHPLFQRAIGVGKQVMSETSLGEGRLSIASVAVEYARRIFDHFNDKTVLSIGAGKMAVLVLQHFREVAPGRLLVCNRDPNKAQSLARRFGGQPAAFEQLDEHLAAADIVISSTGAPHAIITRSRFEQLSKLRRYKPVFLIDIALPRDIEAEVGELENVYLYNLDDLQKVVASTQSQRVTAVDAARKIVEQQVEEFATWHRQREMGPLIDRLYRRYHRIAQQEISRTVHKLPNAGQTEKELLEHLGRRIVNKLLHDPVHILRSSANGMHSPTAQYLHALERLFKLAEEQDAQQGNNGGQENSV
jgi:glutamyl-tRNA reductase